MRASLASNGDIAGPSSLPPTSPSLLAGVSQIAASQVALALAGLVSLPVLAQHLGPQRYGEFSLFVTVLGVVAYQDFARQLVVHEQAKQRASERDLIGLTRLSTVGITFLALLAGAWLLEPVSAIALSVATLLHGLASRDFAHLCVAGRVASATAVRNAAWAFAFACATALVFVTSSTLAFAAPFVLANLAIWIAYRRLACSPAPSDAHSGGSLLARASGWAHLRTSPELAHYRRESANLLGFTIAASVLACADRVLLERLTDAHELGVYAAQADLAQRVNVISSALASALFPMLARELHERGYDFAARKLVGIAGVAVLGFFVLACALLAFERPIVGWLLGDAYLGGPRIFGWMLVGLLVQVFGFLLTPWQRAQGDFATSRRAYNVAMVAMVGVGLVLVPLYGATGALIAFLVARVAELQMLASEARRLPRAILPRWKIAAALGLLVLFACAAGFSGSRS